MRRIICLACVAAILYLFSCSDNTGTGWVALLNYPEESASASLFFSGQMYAPHLLTETIDRELTLLRRGFADSVPVVNIKFWPPWQPGGIRVDVDSAYADSFLQGTYPPFIPLQRQYNLSVHQSVPWTTTYLAIVAPTPLNSARLAEKFIGMPGLSGVHTTFFYFPYPPILLRAAYGGQVHYFIESEACPDVYSRYDHFVVGTKKAVHVGTHWQCPPNNDSMFFALPLEEFFKWQQDWIDSSAAHAPAWVDTAYAVIRHWSHDSGVHWYRPGI